MQHPKALSGGKEPRGQRFRQALLLPAAILPLAGLLASGGDLLARAGFRFAAVLTAAGFALIDWLPLLVAVSLAYALSTARPGLAALSAAAACLALEGAAAALLDLLRVASEAPLHLGLLPGFTAGLTVSCIGNSIRRARWPGWIAESEPSRALPFLAVAAGFFEGAVFGIAWTFGQRQLAAYALRLPGQGAAGAFVYGFLSRLLAPIGLQHVLNGEIWHRYGEFTDQSGQLVLGDLNRYLAGDPTAGRSIAGFYPMLVFALPAIALCLILTAKPHLRARTAVLAGLAGLTALASGIAEPLEYLILFTSPLLYLLLSLLYGLSHLIAQQLQIQAGFHFSAGLGDYLAGWDQMVHPERIWQVGLVMAALSFALFYLAVRFLKLPAFGRENREGEPGHEIFSPAPAPPPPAAPTSAEPVAAPQTPVPRASEPLEAEDPQHE